MWPNLQENAALVTFTEEILNGKLHFFAQCDSNTYFQHSLKTKNWSSSPQCFFIINQKNKMPKSCVLKYRRVNSLDFIKYRVIEFLWLRQKPYQSAMAKEWKIEIFACETFNFNYPFFASIIVISYDYDKSKEYVW